MKKTLDKQRRLALTKGFSELVGIVPGEKVYLIMVRDILFKVISEKEVKKSNERIDYGPMIVDPKMRITLPKALQRSSEMEMFVQKGHIYIVVPKE